MISDERNKNGAHILTSLTYIGKNREKDNGVKMARTFEIARRNNEKSGITSALAINDNYIIQNIEGSRLDVNELITRIITERPHLFIHVVDIKEVETRKWDGFLISLRPIKSHTLDDGTCCQLLCKFTERRSVRYFTSIHVKETRKNLLYLYKS